MFIDPYYKLRYGKLLYFRQMCALKLLNISGPIEGEGKIVELYESQLYRSKYNVGQRLGTGLFTGGINRHDNSKIFLVQVPNRKAETLLPILYRFLPPNSDM
ncbi:hypothetical protein RF11_09421 [Thelohanellus kitauei]|uniref:Uncharacterized protein n=1 Tax=Thelohanellus kitauei TaxID=669202 RepID=A0A0C2N9W6_THEKT|nr:hypothetical protein RF11_09421 [Thelohanellus kitauei]